MSNTMHSESKIVQVTDLGLMSYEAAWAYQTKLHNELKNYKLSKNKEAELFPGHHLLFCEHPHVYTLGRTGSLDHLLLDKEDMEREQVEFFKINRGGDITYHGPGQLVVYPILDLEYFFRDVHRYVRNLEEIIIRLVAEYGLKAERNEGYTGVWLPPRSNDGINRKICAIGVHLSRWVSLHGLALNVNSDLKMFDHIIPCGIAEQDKTVSSIQHETGQKINMQEVKQKLLKHFEEVFECHCRLTSSKFNILNS